MQKSVSVNESVFPVLMNHSWFLLLNAFVFQFTVRVSVCAYIVFPIIAVLLDFFFLLNHAQPVEHFWFLESCLT